MSAKNRAILMGLSLGLGMFDMLGAFSTNEDSKESIEEEDISIENDKYITVSWSPEIPKCVRDQSLYNNKESEG
jgi:hypothetical protein